MKITEILESRRNPSVNKKESTLDSLGKYRGQNVFISYTASVSQEGKANQGAKIGINPRSEHNTPLGIYAYPIDYVLGLKGQVPFAGSSPFVWVFKPVGRVLDLAVYTQDDFTSDCDKIKSIYQVTSQQLGEWCSEASKSSFGGQIWNITRNIALLHSKPTTYWNKVFRDLGYNGVIDSNNAGIIHNNEPTQAVFFSKTSIHTLKLLRNISPSAPLSNVEIWIRQPKALLALLQSGRMTDDEFASIVKNNPKLLRALLDSELSPELRSRIRQLNTATVIRSDGTQEWYQNDKLHRLDGPAYIDADGSQSWWQNGKRHRLDGPAVIRADGTQEWWQNGKLHRLDGPAIIYADGTQQWFVDGKLHRVDGPAVIQADGMQAWYQNGKHHRLDGPAIILANGRKEWWVNDKRHRVDGPAVIYADGSKVWYQDGKRHRLDGPAIIHADGSEEWYKNGVKIKSPTTYK